MKSIVLIIIALILSSCVENTSSISISDITIADSKCKANEGIKSIHFDAYGFTVNCNNTAFYNSKATDYNDPHYGHFSREELYSCTENCNPNGGLLEIQVHTYCSKDAGGKFAKCLEYKGEVKCMCKNEVATKMSHVVKVQ